ncbi:MAG TPA: hypothetical protein ENJ19_11235 [Gammaproteobacteria bacterium]|nr:hypothetical protein [Gammaproteobacteria bacterium]
MGRKLFATLAATLLLSACASLLEPFAPLTPESALPPAEPAPKAPAVPAAAAKEKSPEELALVDAAWLLEYYRSLDERKRAELKAEYAAVREALEIAPTAREQLRLAILMTVPRTPYYNPNRSAKLLRTFADESSQPAPLRNLAYLIHDKVRTRQRSNRQLRAARRELKARQAEIDTLHQQLEALKVIERSLHERKKIEMTDTP